MPEEVYYSDYSVVWMSSRGLMGLIYLSSSGFSQWMWMDGRVGGLQRVAASDEYLTAQNFMYIIASIEGRKGRQVLMIDIHKSVETCIYFEGE